LPAEGIAQLAHAAGESSLCCEGWKCVLPNDFGEDLLLLRYKTVKVAISAFMLLVWWQEGHLACKN